MARDKEFYKAVIENIFENKSDHRAIKDTVLKEVNILMNGGYIGGIEIIFQDNNCGISREPVELRQKIPIDFKNDKEILDIISDCRGYYGRKQIEKYWVDQNRETVESAFKKYAEQYPGLDIEIDDINYRYFRTSDEKTTVKFTVNGNIPIEITLLPAEMREPQIINAIINAIDAASRPYLYHEDLIKRINDVKPKIKGGQNA